MLEIDRAREQIGRAAQTAHLGIGSWMHDRRHLFGTAGEDHTVPNIATRDSVLIHAALTYLVANDLITIADDNRFAEWLATGFDEPWSTIMSERLVATVAAAASIRTEAVPAGPVTLEQLAQDVWGPPGEPVDPLLPNYIREQDRIDAALETPPTVVGDGCDAAPGV